MFFHVIVGVDGSAAGRDALPLARQLASSDGRLTLASVQVVTPGPEPDSGAVSLATHRRDALERLDALRQEWHVDAQLLCIDARSVAEGLHELAVRHGADLLVIGASRRDAVDRLLVGDDTSAVLERAPCAVAVAPVGYAARRPVLKRIGAAYDGSPQSERALALARALAAERSAQVSVFEAVPEPVFVDDPWQPEPEVDAYVAQTRRRLAELGDVEAHAAAGDTVEELARYGASVDLLVLGSHRSRPADALMSGSTAQRLADSPSCPLLVLST